MRELSAKHDVFHLYGRKIKLQIEKITDHLLKSYRIVNSLCYAADRANRQAYTWLGLDGETSALEEI